MFTDRCNTEKSTETAPLLDLKGKSVLKRSEEGATGGNQVLEGLPRGGLDRVQLRSARNQAVLRLPDVQKIELGPSRRAVSGGPDQKKIQSVIDITRERMIDEIKKAIRDGLGRDLWPWPV